MISVWFPWWLQPYLCSHQSFWGKLPPARRDCPLPWTTHLPSASLWLETLVSQLQIVTTQIWTITGVTHFPRQVLVVLPLWFIWIFPFHRDSCLVHINFNGTTAECAPLLSGFSHPRLLGSEARHLATGKEIMMHDQMVHLGCCEDMKKEKGVTCLGNLLDRAFDRQ